MKYLLSVILIVGVLGATVDHQNGGGGSSGGDSHPKQGIIQKKFGFFGGIFQIGRLAFEQFSDTKNTVQKIMGLINDGFDDSPPPKKPTGKDDSTTTASPSDSDTETTTKLSRSEFGRIINRNLRGLQKLLKLEINDALNQTKYNVVDYKKEFKDSIRKSQSSLSTTPSSDE